MWFKLLLCCLVGLTYADPAWKPNTEYTYEVRGSSLSSLSRASDYYSGIALRAKLVLQPRPGKLTAKIVHPEYAEVKVRLPEGWTSELPDAELKYKSLEMTDKPFEIVVKNGIVSELIVEASVPEWEANIIKSFVSQIQLDIGAERRTDSQYNIYPKPHSNNAVFKVLEDTVTGITETSYDIHPLPEYILQTEPYLAPFPHLKGDGSILEIVKNKNFTEGYDLPSYYFGYGYTGLWEPSSNHFAHFSQRNSMGRAVITGTLQRYTIQYSETTNKIVLLLNEDGEPAGYINSMMRIQLANAVPQKGKLPELSSPVSLGSLVYAYGKQGPVSNKVSQGKIFLSNQYQGYKHDSTESHDTISNHLSKRNPRSASEESTSSFFESSEDSVQSEEDWTSAKPHLKEAPWFPMLPFYIGYNGMPIKNAPHLQMAENVYNLILKVSEELDHPQDIPRENTLAKYVLLTSMIRTMDERELKQLVQRVFTSNTESKEYYTWVVVRDILAEAGTGPAFLVIKNLIESRKLYGSEASAVIVTMERAARQPSYYYMEAFYELVKQQMKVQEEDQSMLNETMLFSFTNLVHKVYVNKKFSHREYPTHSFGHFYTKQGETLIKDDVLPYLAKQLREAVKNGDAHKIQAYIVALGNTGHRDIVYVFEPYLEGKIQASQFQRFLMVLALRHLSDVYPERVQPILYRIYQNVGERMETRIIALYKLMHTNPSSEMLQRIAAFSNYEPNHAVRAASISVLETASKLEGLEFAELRSAAESAKPLLSKGKAGILDSMSLIVNYASLNWASYQKHVLQTVVFEESGVPTGLYYALEGNNSGLKYRSIGLEAIVSDIRNAFHVFLHQTEWYQQQQNKQQNSQQSEKSLWSSHKIASLLNMKTDELEQLEARMYLQISEFKKHLIFNNHSIEILPQFLQKLEKELLNGKQIELTKLINIHESALAFPTELGLPFLYTYDYPVLLHLEGNFRGKAQPKFSTGDKLIIPDEVHVESNFRVVFSGKKRIQFGLVTPFNHHQYLTGYEQNLQVYLPLKTVLNIDLNKKSVEFKLESLDYENEINILHKSSLPYVTKHNILNLHPVTEGKHIHVIRKLIQHQYNKTIGIDSVGVPLSVRYETDAGYSPIESLMKGNIFETPIHYEKLDVGYMYGKKHNKEIKASFKYVGQQSERDGTEYSRKGVWERMSNLPEDDEQRVNELSKQASAGIPGAFVHIFDSKVKFSGHRSVEFTASLAYGKSHLRSKARILGYVKKQSQIPKTEPFEGAISVNYNMSRLSGLNLNHVMHSDPTSFIDIDAAFEEKLRSESEVQISAVLTRSSARKEYLTELPYYSLCQREMIQGNTHLLACANMTHAAGLLDHVKVNLTYTSMDSYYLYNLVNSFNRFSPYYKFNVYNNRYSNYKDGEIKFDIRFEPDLQSVNVSIASKKTYASIKNIYINEWTRPVVVKHPVFDVIDRVQAKLYGIKTFTPMCSMDKSQAYTFDGAEYPLKLSTYWTVILQYVPHRSMEYAKSSVEEQLKHEVDNYVVLARQSKENPDSKELKIVVSTPRTDGQVVEVEMKPVSGGNYPQVFVNGQEVPVANEDKAYESHQTQIAVVDLPGGEVYVEVRDGFYVIYDGVRFKISPLSLKLRNAIRGLCGLFDGRKNDDFVTPSNCVVREPREFIASYTVMQGGEQNGEITNLKSVVQNGHCIHRKVPLYVNYISKKSDGKNHHYSKPCTKYQTRYTIENDKICFTTKPQSVCKTGCRQHGTISKYVDVHCVQNSNVASLWKSQIDKGASPDFSTKPVTKTVNLELPQTCRSL